MSINVISTATRKRVPTSAGTVREIITADDAEAKHVRASIHDIEPNKTLELNSGHRTHLVYVIEGSGANSSIPLRPSSVQAPSIPRASIARHGTYKSRRKHSTACRSARS